MTESEKYLDALLNGNNKIISEIYDKFYPKVKSYILFNSGQEDDVNDVFHDALMYFMVSKKDKSLNINNFGSYFFTVCKNIWLKSLKDKKKWVINDETDHLIDKETELSILIVEQKRLELYQSLFQKLSSNCREILSSYFNGMSYEEVMDELSYSSINTVRQRVFKCKAKMIKLIKEDNSYNNLK